MRVVKVNVTRILLQWKKNFYRLEARKIGEKINTQRITHSARMQSIKTVQIILKRRIKTFF